MILYLPDEGGRRPSKTSTVVSASFTRSSTRRRRYTALLSMVEESSPLAVHSQWTTRRAITWCGYDIRDPADDLSASSAYERVNETPLLCLLPKVRSSQLTPGDDTSLKRHLRCLSTGWRNLRELATGASAHQKRPDMMHLRTSEDNITITVDVTIRFAQPYCQQLYNWDGTSVNPLYSKRLRSDQTLRCRRRS
jgi:hypothetical protein